MPADAAAIQFPPEIESPPLGGGVRAVICLPAGRLVVVSIDEATRSALARFQQLTILPGGSRMDRFLTRTVLCLSVVAMVSSAEAAPVLDQNNPTVNTPHGGFCQIITNNFCGQSFQQAGDNISGAGIFVHPDWAAGDGVLTVSVYTSYSGVPSGFLASGVSGTVNSGSGWVDVFWLPVAVNPATTYYLVLSSTNQNLVAAYSQFGAYAAGNALHSGSPTAYAQYDLTFRTYRDEGVASVPEPMSLTMFGAGVLGVAVLRRRIAG